jgi:exodeoxyribonuclease VII small subunit
MATKKARFEESMRRLEEIVRELETANLPLDESLAKFEEGVKLGKVCKELLEKAEARIKVLVEDDAGTVREEDAPYDSKD